MHARHAFTGFLCLYEAWSLTLREEHRFRMFYSRVLKRTFEDRRRIKKRLKKIQ
jgi:hypothetical protein